MIKLISFEGNDGSGKSTAAKHLFDWAEKEGLNPILFREPGSTSLGEKLRGIIADESIGICNVAELFIFQAARVQLIKEYIKPALDAGKLVILDRFCDSTWVYQGYCKGVRLVDIEFCNRLAINDLIPTVTFFLNTAPELCLQRIKQRGKASKDELDLSWLKKIHSGYHELLNLYPKRIKTINGEQSMEDIDKLIQFEVKKIFC